MSAVPQPILEESGHALDVRAVGRLAMRTQPYLWPALVELKPLLWVGLPLLVLSLPAGMLGADLFINRMLNGEPLTEFEAWLLPVDPAEFVMVESLSIGGRQLIRDRLVVGTVGTAIFFTPIVPWARYPRIGPNYP